MTVETDFERRIAGAFNERARSLPSAVGLELMSSVREQPTRRPTRVLVLALVMLLVISGAGALIAMRRSGGNSSSVEGGGTGSARYRSVAIVSVFPNASGSSAATPDLVLPDPVRLAMAPGVRKAALKKSGTDPAHAHVVFDASINAVGTRLTLVVTAPTGPLANSVARSWESEIAVLRQALVRKQVAMSAPAAKLRYLTGELATIDTDLAKLDPANYRNLLQYDEGPKPPGSVPAGVSSNGGGLRINRFPSPLGPPPVPERGTVHELNLAFERIQLLSAREKAESAEAELSIEANRVVTDWVSLTPPTRVGVSR